MSAGVAQVIVGVSFRTLIVTLFVAVVKLAASVGVNVTDSVWFAPALSTAPASGVYTKVPVIPPPAVAFSCVAPSAVPKVMSAGFAHVMTGVAFKTLIETVLVALDTLAVSAGVNVTDNVWFAPAFSAVPASGV